MDMKKRAFNVTLSTNLLAKLELLGRLGRKQRSVAEIMRTVLGDYVDERLKGIPNLDEILKQIEERSNDEATSDSEEDIAMVDTK